MRNVYFLACIFILCREKDRCIKAGLPLAHVVCDIFIFTFKACVHNVYCVVCLMYTGDNSSGGSEAEGGAGDEEDYDEEGDYEGEEEA